MSSSSRCSLSLNTAAAVGAALAAAVGVVEELSTTGGVNIVIGVRPSIWARIADPAQVPTTVEDWTDDLVGPDGFTMPATPHDDGDVGDHGTVFVGFSLEQWRLTEMLRRMAGMGDGVRCALTRYLTPLTGAYYVVPSVTALEAFAPPDD